MSELKKCKQCKDAGELSNEDIPKWSRQAGNYSPYPPFFYSYPHSPFVKESLQ